MNESFNCLTDEQLFEIEERLARQKQRLITEIARHQLITKCYQQFNQTNSNQQQLNRNLIVLKSRKNCDILLTRINHNQHVMDMTGDHQLKECREIDSKIGSKDLNENCGCVSTYSCVESEPNDDTTTKQNQSNSRSVTQLVLDAISSADQSVIGNVFHITRATNRSAVDLNNNETKRNQTITGYSATDEIIVESILEKWSNENKTNTENSRPQLKWRPKRNVYYRKKRARTIKRLIGKANRIKSAIK